MALRDRICRQIFSLASNPPKAQVHQALDPLLEIDFSDTEDDIHRIFHDCEGEDKDAGDSSMILDVTPIMVACDQGNVVCLEYMLQKFVAIEKIKEHVRLKRARRNKLKTLLGNPLSDVSTTNHNSALHHAAMAGCTPAIQLLQRIQIHLFLNDKYCPDDQEIHDKENQDQAEANRSNIAPNVPTTPIVLLLGSTCNNHNDTPLMMATQSSHALDFVETWYNLALKEQLSMGNSMVEASAVLRGVIQAKNDSGDSCLSLACSHGRIELVKFLVCHDEDGKSDGDSQGAGSGETQPISNSQKCKVEVTADEVYKCKGSFQRMEQALNSSPELKKQYQSQRDHVEACLKIVEAQLQFLSERATRELLEQEDNASSHRTDMAAKLKRKKKKKPKKTSTINSSNTTADDAPEKEISSGDNKNDEGWSHVVLKTLPDGKTAVEVKGKEEDVVKKDPILRGLNSTIQSHDASDLLRERFKGISDEVDSVMSALCLDVKCLLFSDHGMALNLSPAQLDAVQQILEKQLESVKKARDIQQRMHETGAGNEPKSDSDK